jgi:L-amino acid N-acyltransferase YncA
MRFARWWRIRLVGTFGSAGLELGRWVDVVLMQRALGMSDQTLP